MLQGIILTPPSHIGLTTFTLMAYNKTFAVTKCKMSEKCILYYDKIHIKWFSLYEYVTISRREREAASSLVHACSKSWKRPWSLLDWSLLNYVNTMYICPIHLSLYSIIDVWLAKFSRARHENSRSEMFVGPCPLFNGINFERMRNWST